MPRLLRLEPVLAHIGQTRSPFYACIAAGTMTKPVKLGARAAAWPSDEVEAIIQARIAGANDANLRKLVEKLHAQRQGAA